MSADTPNIHRYLDDAFAGIPMTPDLQDLKEEIRGNLSARAADLEAGGMDATQAASTAISELGDISELLDSGAEAEPTPVGETESIARTVARNHVKPKPGFVVRAVVLSIVATAAVVLVVLGALSILHWSTTALVALSALAALAIGGITVDSLRQEASSTYALPTGRALGYGAAAAICSFGLLAAGIFLRDTDQLWLLIAGIVLTLGAIIGFVWLGVTQTNRTKPWMLEVQRRSAASDPFSQDPAAAARFGMYTVIIWVVAFAAFAALSIWIGFVWSWIALIAGLVVFMLTLARMLFAAEKKSH
jgi:hypothetical protein